MVSHRIKKALTSSQVLLLVCLCNWLAASTAGALSQAPLNRIPVPEPANLKHFVKDKPAAIRLGKALFWDMQVGSDGVQACASCHFRAGADSRLKNQINPGSDTIFGNNSTVLNTIKTPMNPRLAPNYTLQSFDFPLFKPIPEVARLAIDPATGLTNDTVTLLQDTNDVVGSQGIMKTDFDSVLLGSAMDIGTPVTDTVFSVGSTRLRQVTRRNAPSVINAVFNFSNNWDGRANSFFNGQNQFGPMDPTAGVWYEEGTAITRRPVVIPTASLASQAVESALSDTDMSYKGRSFKALGRKLLSLPPLGQQLVHPNDSVLGPFFKATLNPNQTISGGTGITVTYGEMIAAAFHEELLASPFTTPDGYSQMEGNFALFFGLAIQLYEATLVSDRTPFDRFQAGNQNALSASAQNGLAIFNSKCTTCHSGSELTSAAVGSTRAIGSPFGNPVVFTNNSSHRLIQTGQTTLAGALSDTGFFNTGVRPTADDIGRGGSSPTGFPLSFSGLSKLQAQGLLPFVTPQMLPGLPASSPVNVAGAFKTPALRNVELTAPYFHNGSAFTLEEVVEFYARGGNFPDNPELATAMQPVNNLRSSATKRSDLVAFLKSLTDERVRNETAPFDHPQLMVPNGEPELPLIELPATGGTALDVAPTLTIDPVASPSTLTSRLFSGSVDATATVEVTVNELPPAFAAVSGTGWSFHVPGLLIGSNTITITASSPSGITTSRTVVLTVLPTASISGVPPGGKTTVNSATLTIAGTDILSYQYSLNGGAFSTDTPVAKLILLNNLPDGSYTVAVLGKDAHGNQQPATTPTTATWTVKATPPVLTLDVPVSPTRETTRTINGTVELGAVPSVTISTPAVTGPVKVIGGNGIGTWSCDISGLVPGLNTITVRVLDFVFNLTTRSGEILVMPADGNFKGSGVTDLSDALKALRIAVGLDLPTVTDLLHGDVSPFIDGGVPDGTITVADALMIIKKVVGLINF